MSTSKNELPFSSSNYVMMLIGIAVILAGFLIMTFDPAEFGFGFLGMTLGPVITVAGFIIEFWAILRKPANS
jgi:hypothetical protein